MADRWKAYHKNIIMSQTTWELSYFFISWIDILLNRKVCKFAIFLLAFQDERSGKRNQILQKTLANWLNSEGNTDAAFMVIKYRYSL